MQIGMIGLGRMGANMVRRLLRGGHECIVNDRNPEAVQTLVNEGAIGAASLDGFISKLKAPRAIWIGKINVYSSDDGAMQLLDERVNRLPTPFELEWRHISKNPWDWRLVRVSNPAFQIPADVSY